MSFIKQARAMGISPFRIHLAVNLAKQYPPADSKHRNRLHWFLLHLAVEAGNGHIRTELSSIPEVFRVWYNSSSESGNTLLETENDLEELISEGLKSNLIGRLEKNDSLADSFAVPRPPLVLSADGKFIYFLKRRRAEDRLLERLSSRCRTDASANQIFPLPAGKNLNGPEGALIKLLAQGKRLLFLSGGPGTGKTTTIRKLLELIEQGRKDSNLPPAEIILTAPTGRAASRLGGQTLHACLKIRPAGPAGGHSIRPLKADMVVVDETSMVDINLMNMLLEALPENARLLLVGDPDQLPSVGSGALLSDLLLGEQSSAGEGPLKESVVRLTRVYRSDTGVLSAAKAIVRGDYGELKEAFVQDGLTLNPLGEQEHAVQRIADTYREMLRRAGEHANPQTLLVQLEKQAVLTPLRRGIWGVPELNRRISLILGGKAAVVPGTPVVITRNDAERNLWNGDKGMILEREKKLRAYFPDSEGWRDYPLSALSSWEPAYVQTIHTSQGSEYDSVSIVLPRGSGRLISREILYTAVTRARHSVHLYADEDVIKNALEETIVRNSRIRDWARFDRDHVLG